jgi:hypothetical protein
MYMIDTTYRSVKRRNQISCINLSISHATLDSPDSYLILIYHDPKRPEGKRIP